MKSSARTPDLAIVGAGAAGTHTLRALIKELSASATRRPRPVHIVVIDRDWQPFAGVAYGHRSSRTSLTLSTVRDFLPDDERARFTTWLARHRDELSHAGAYRNWRDRHRADITAGRWDRLFIPRRLYGEFLGDCTRDAMGEAQSKGVAEFTLVTAEVTSIRRSNDRYLITAAEGNGRAVHIDTAVALLALGSPPTSRLPARDALGNGVIDDIYDPGLDATLSAVHTRLVGLPSEDREVLVVGGNAAALEFVVTSHELVSDLRAHVTVLSPAGRPRHWRRSEAGEVVKLDAMSLLRSRAAANEPLTAAELYDAVVADLEAAIASGSDMAAARRMGEWIPGLIECVHDEDRVALAAHYGLAITKLLRRDSSDTVDVLEALVQSGAVSFRAGRYVDGRPEGRGFRVTAIDDDGREETFEQCYGVIVGAIGFEGVSVTRAQLVRQLLRDGLVEASSSNAGLRVDSCFQAAPRVFVVGPLLAGNANPRFLVWHAESVRRIIAIAPDAAACVARELARVRHDSSLTASRST